VAGKNGRKRYPDPAQNVLGQEPDRAGHLARPPQSGAVAGVLCEEMALKKQSRAGLRLSDLRIASSHDPDDIAVQWQQTGPLKISCPGLPLPFPYKLRS
jgi:hypothetical protein